MRIPTIRGVIERRLLVNFRADPDVVSRVLPAPFEPIVVEGNGHAVVGICLIRLSGVRPVFVPALLPGGLRSENAAHRIAVRWRDGSGYKEGVYIPRRDSSSRLNALAGGRLFPGVHHRAVFRIAEEPRSNPNRFDIEMTSRDGRASLGVRGVLSAEWPGGSVFADLAAASDFFRRGSLGYSPGHERGKYDGLELSCRAWSMEAVRVESVRSSFFEDAAVFPRGSIEFDCALVMRNIAHEWHGRGQMCCAEAAA